MHTIKITPNLLFEYQCTSVIAESNRIEKIDSVARIESNGNFFCPNWNAQCIVRFVGVCDRENFRAVFQLLDNYCFVIHPLADYSIEVFCY